MRNRLAGGFRWLLLLCVVVLCVVAAPACAQAPGAAPAGRLLVLSKRAHTLAIVNPGTLRVEARVAAGDDPHEVIADGDTAWVSNYGFGAFHTLSVVDLAAQRPLPPVELGPLGGAHGLWVSQGKVWFTTELAKAVGRYDPVAKKVDLVIGDGQDRTHMVWVTPDGMHVIATNVASGTVSFLDQVDRVPPSGPPPGAGAAAPGGPPPTFPNGLQKDWEQTLVRVGPGSEGFDVSPDGRLVWVGNAGDGTISIIDRASRQLLQTLPLNANGVNRLKFTPDGKSVLLSGVRGQEPLWIVDADSHTVVKKLRVGRGSGGVLVEPGGRRAYVACSPDGYVAVVDLRSMEMVGRVDAGPEPDGMAWASGGR